MSFLDLSYCEEGARCLCYHYLSLCSTVPVMINQAKAEKLMMVPSLIT